MFCRLSIASVKYFTIQPLLAIVLCRNLRRFVILLGSVTLVFFVYSLVFGMRAPEIGKTSSLEYFNFFNTDDIVVFEQQVRASNASNSGITTSSGKAIQSLSLQNVLFKIQRRVKSRKQMAVATSNGTGAVRSEREDKAFSRVVLVITSSSQDELLRERRNLTLEVATRSTCSEVLTPTVGTTVTTTTATSAVSAQSHKVDISRFRSTSTNVSCVIYNRVPKCGSSTVLSIFSTISRQNGVSYVWSSIYTRPHINVNEQVIIGHGQGCTAQCIQGTEVNYC